MLAVIEYGMGNIKSVTNALDHLGIENVLTSDKDVIRKSDGLILPGVGAFDRCMYNLNESGLTDVIKSEAARGKKILGICLGMQVLFDKGYEGKECDGLGLIPGYVRKMVCDEKIPNIGWNSLEILKEDKIADGLSNKSFMYFVHSYYAVTEKQYVVAAINYGGINVPGIVMNKNVIGMQFHPEKSGEEGMRLLKNFEELDFDAYNTGN